MAEAEKTCPPLPDGSVDFNEMHNAAARGHDLDKALEKATFKIEPPEEPEQAEAVTPPAPVAAQTEKRVATSDAKQDKE